MRAPISRSEIEAARPAPEEGAGEVDARQPVPHLERGLCTRAVSASPALMDQHVEQPLLASSGDAPRDRVGWRPSATAGAFVGLGRRSTSGARRRPARWASPRPPASAMCAYLPRPMPRPAPVTRAWRPPRLRAPPGGGGGARGEVCCGPSGRRPRRRPPPPRAGGAREMRTWSCLAAVAAASWRSRAEVAFELVLAGLVLARPGLVVRPSCRTASCSAQEGSGEVRPGDRAARSARPAAMMLLTWSASEIAPTAMVAMPASLRMRSEKGVWNMRP